MSLQSTYDIMSNRQTGQIYEKHNSRQVSCDSYRWVMLF